MTVDRFRVVPAAYIFFRRDWEILLQLREGTGFMDGHWAAAAAGHVEANESVLDAACREAAEELGVMVRSNDLLALTAMHRTQRNNQSIDERVDFFFECRNWVGEPEVQEPQKTARLAWFPLEALPHPVVPHEKAVIDAIITDRLEAIMTFGFA